MSGIPESPMCAGAPLVNPSIGIEKRCSKCHETKALNEFNRDSQKRTGLSSKCRECLKIIAARHRLTNRTAIREAYGKWAKAHPESIKKYGAKWRGKNLAKWNNYSKQWRERNPEQYRAAARDKMREINATVRGSLNGRMRTGMNQSLVKGKQEAKWQDLVGYDCARLKKHLEKHFLPGMTWENRTDWEIDHKIPISAFNFETPDDSDFKKCWALKNLRPLWKTDNRSKNAKLVNPHQPSLLV